MAADRAGRRRKDKEYAKSLFQERRQQRPIERWRFTHIGSVRVQVGMTYQIEHTRKGLINVRLLAILPDKSGIDEVLLECDIDMREGSGKEWLRRGKTVDPITHRITQVTHQISRLRPKLITSIRPVVDPELEALFGNEGRRRS